MNSSARVLFLDRFEAPLLRSLGGDLQGLRVLEIGCGQGHSTKRLIEQFGATSVVAIDLDEDSVRKARRNLSALSPHHQVQLLVEDVSALNMPDHSFDAVVDFAALHHVPNWQQALSEISRVLKPGGRFLFEEVTRQWLNRWFARTFLLHPKENRFNAEEFVAEFGRLGFTLTGELVKKRKGDFIFGCAIKATTTIPRSSSR
ncbi:MAG: class I SAM-dependent methyltransferase [Bdellovibrionaceae bacterium]|nr:class I SAM-dependent methyltransferase [Pseudobdellovibrionaceae bacterium]